MPFGFNFNGISSDPNKAISFSEAIAPAAGPSASLHLFYSVSRAKEMLAQLQEAIAQAEGGKLVSSSEERAGEIYRAFCESDGSLDHSFQEAWEDFQEKNGDIEIGSLTDKLILAAMVYALEYGKNDD